MYFKWEGGNTRGMRNEETCPWPDFSKSSLFKNRMDGASALQLHGKSSIATTPDCYISFYLVERVTQTFWQPDHSVDKNCLKATCLFVVRSQLNNKESHMRSLTVTHLRCLPFMPRPILCEMSTALFSVPHYTETDVEMKAKEETGKAWEILRQTEF